MGHRESLHIPIPCANEGSGSVDSWETHAAERRGLRSHAERGNEVGLLVAPSDFFVTA